MPAAPVGQPHEVVLTADGVGAWEIAVADGATVARVPITVAAPAPTPGWVWAVRIGAVLGVVALIAALAPSVRQRPRLALSLGAVAIVGLTIAATAVATAPATPSAATPAAAPVDPAAAPAGGHAGHGGGAMPDDAGNGHAGHVSHGPRRRRRHGAAPPRARRPAPRPISSSTSPTAPPARWSTTSRSTTTP